MSDKKPRSIKWTDEALAAEAAKYTTRGDFLKANPSAYMTAKRKGIYESITKHMFKARFKWTKEMLVSEAKKYDTRTEFFKKSRSAYEAAVRMGVYEDITKHMPTYSGRGKKRGPNIRTLRKEAAVNG